MSKPDLKSTPHGADTGDDQRYALQSTPVIVPRKGFTMLADLKKADRSEGAFTLIELLVVMIIIAILMAVAIPTCLSQKNTAVKTAAIANMKQFTNALES